MANHYCSFLFIVAWLYLGAAVPAWAQMPGQPNIRFRRIDMESGLSQNNVQAILQDKKGFVWFGTANGLNKFDGQKVIRIYHNLPQDSTSLSGNRVGALCEDRQGYLWVGSTEGLDRFDPRRETFKRYSTKAPEGQPRGQGMVLALHEDRQGNLWAGTFGNGLLKIDAKREVIRFFRHDPENDRSLANDSVYALAEDARGDIWVGTGGGGLDCYEVANDKFVHHQHHPNNPNSLSGNLVSAVAVAPDGKVWASTYNNGLNLLDPQTGYVTRFMANPADPTTPSSDQMESLLFSPDGQLWVGTGNGLNLLYRQPNGQWGFHHLRHSPADRFSLSSDAAFALAADRSGGVWVGTLNGGANYFHPNTMRFALFRHNPLRPQSLAYDVVRNLMEDRQGNLWVATTKGGLSVATPAQLAKNEFAHYRHQEQNPRSLSSDELFDVFEDRQGHIWVGANNINSAGLNRFVPAKVPGQPGSFVRYDLSQGSVVLRPRNAVRAIRQDWAGNLWVATVQGLLKLAWRPQTDQMAVLDVVNIAASDIAVDSHGHFYVATLNRGVVLVDPTTGEMVRSYAKADVPDGKSLNDNYVRSLYLQNDSILWAGTSSGGLNRLNTVTGQVIVFKIGSGQTGNTIYGLEGDGQGGLWIGGGYGLARLDLKTFATQHYDETDGLQGLEFNTNAHALGRNGRVYFGGLKGFNAFFPREVVQEGPPTPPAALISTLLMFNQPFANYHGGILQKNIAYADTLDLPYDSTNIALQFTMPEFYAPDKHRFEYWLEGVDKHSLTTAQGYPSAAYSNLSPGHYIFHLRGIDQRGQKSARETVLHILVSQPWWSSPWFITLMSVALASLIVFLINYFRSRNQMLERQVRERTELITAQKEEISRQKEQTELSLNSLRKLTDIGKLITATLSAESIVRTVYKNVYSLMSADVFAIGIYNAANHTLDFIGRHTAGAPLPPVSFPIDGPDRLSIRSFVNREEVIIQDYETEYKHYFDAIQPSQVGEQVAHSIVYLPLIAHEKSQGVITVQSFRRDAYLPYQLEILRNLASYTAIALENADAYRRLEEANHELNSTQSQLVQSEKLASLGRVMAGIAHEINNPLTFVSGGMIGLERNLAALLEIEEKFEELNHVIHDGYLRDRVMNILNQTNRLKEKYDYEEVVSDLHILMRDIKEGANRAADIVKNMRNFSRTNNNELYPGDLHREIDFALTMLRHKMGEKVKVVKEYDERMPIVLSNHGRLNQVFTNILENAIHALDGEGTILVRTHAGDEQINLHFKDTGKGMTEAVKAKIFEPFFTTKEVGKGTGLGLAVSFGIIQDLKGSIEVHSAPQKGAEFVVNLPKLTLKS
jgi:signal transduction histidine kinase/ligand-binding sensor domain-containing protein